MQATTVREKGKKRGERNWEQLEHVKTTKAKKSTRALVIAAFVTWWLYIHISNNLIYFRILLLGALLLRDLSFHRGSLHSDKEYVRKPTDCTVSLLLEAFQPS